MPQSRAYLVCESEGNMQNIQRSTRIGLWLLPAVFLFACGKKPEPVSINEAQAKQALSTFIAARNPVCQAYFAKWPVQVSEYDVRNRSYHAVRMAALQSAGLVSFTMEKILPQGMTKASGKDFIPVKSYNLSALGQEVYKADNEEAGRFCYAHKVLESVSDVTPAKPDGKSYTSSLHFVYQLTDVAPWATDPKMLDAFPIMKRELEGVGVQQSMTLTRRDTQWTVDEIASL